MCCSRVRVLEESTLEIEETQVEMDSPTAVTIPPDSVPTSNDDQPRLKFLCSFNGSILPRPQDGKLRYVGGETRIVSVPRDINFEELMGKMKELFDGASVLKYQQPDEDLDALVSVVNDDDVTNMMEDYEKLGSGDGFTRLRIFLFSSIEQDDSIHFVERDERDNERRYVDALNSHNDFPEVQGMTPVDDVQLIDQYYNQLNIDNNLQNQRNFEMPMMGVNLRHVNIPHQHSPTQKYPDMESPWSPAYYSPRHEFPNSPSSSRYHSPYTDQVDRVPQEDYFRQQQHFNHQPQYDQQSPLPQNPVWMPPTNGFPGNILPINEALDIPNIGNGFPHAAEGGIWHGNYPNAYGNENLYHPSSHGHVPPNAFWRNGQTPSHGHGHGIPPYEASQENGACNIGYIRTNRESSSRIPVGMENQNLWVDSSPKVTPINGGVSFTDHSYGHRIPTEPVPFVPPPVQFIPEPVQLSPDSVHFTPEIVQFSPEIVSNLKEKDGFGGENLNLTINQVNGDESSHKDKGTSLKNEEHEVHDLSNAPQNIESVDKSQLEGAKEVEIEAQDDVNDARVCFFIGDVDTNTNTQVDLDRDSGSDNQSNSKIEETKAEEEAKSRGLQTIKNDDLEEIRELGTGTYGAVYHGKWKGSDVAIKRIKASCFAGRPSERERLIADFWKEALILSSLHHPNVVSFYGIVRDGPDGSLATVTEFMVNGSLKQFLQKKDRTIDRRKRLIIAMDASFGMEYLHGKNIVHFDLKCENLLVNMRDPHRPICKIGDLGLSKVKQHTLVSGGVRGTLPWMAPELLSGKNHMVSEKIDVYSFGIVMWELLTGDEPYGDLHCASIIGGIVNNSLRPTIPTWCDPEWKALMASCWSSDPTERPSFSQISHKLRTMAAAINVK
ncbi:unnamed protein product [Lactuca saligna]|uniref:Protein kinase domain-containing protein n=1 Tax=Lactuca saligna TaxID=75948 RepID=A0AA36EEM0_LACSI|nr:unnamed protein product [Lactuca saligna]